MRKYTRAEGRVENGRIAGAKVLLQEGAFLFVALREEHMPEAQSKRREE